VAITSDGSCTQSASEKEGWNCEFSDSRFEEEWKVDELDLQPECRLNVSPATQNEELLATIFR
jgi:hypothetical protein